MATFTKTLADAAARMVFRTAEVAAVTDHSSRFRSIALAGRGLRNAGWHLGDKLQVRTDRDGFAPRTYTPIGWDPGAGTTTLLAYIHGAGPGSAWARGVAAGDTCQVFGPRRSIKLDEVGGPLVLVGDETSFALAAAWTRAHPDAPPVAALFEVSDPGECRGVLDAFDVDARLVARTDDAGHLDELTSNLIETLHANRNATLCLTGKAQTIATLRKAIKADGTSGHPTLVKAYWDENRTGLD